MSLPYVASTQFSTMVSQPAGIPTVFAIMERATQRAAGMVEWTF